MRAFELIAERRIEEAMARGAFDDLELAGVPVDLTDYFNLPAELRMAWTILRNANCVPEEVALSREIERLKQRFEMCTSEEARRILGREIRDREMQLRMKMEESRRGRPGR